MHEFMSGAYPWIKALHIIAVIAWMAGLLYLPRLFVNHAGVDAGTQASEMLKGMEGRLMRIIMRPAGLMTILFGGMLLSTPGIVDWSMTWIWLKLLFVLGLLAMHGMMEGWRAAFARDANTKPAKFFRMINEVPTLLMIFIVLLVVAKPF
jgi:putative membrane protein